MREEGVMLIELLLVIAVAVVLIFIGLERYRAYYQSMQYQLIQNDIVTIRDKLNQYYNEQSCDVNGRLNGMLDSDLIDKLDVNTHRSPYITHYHALIHDTGAQTQSGKPVYHIEVSAELESQYDGLFDYLTRRLQGTRLMGNTIYWSTLPNTLVVHPKRVLWVMDVSRQQFKNVNNMIDAGGMSHSYCFR